MKQTLLLLNALLSATLLASPTVAQDELPKKSRDIRNRRTQSLCLCRTQTRDREAVAVVCTNFERCFDCPAEAIFWPRHQNSWVVYCVETPGKCRIEADSCGFAHTCCRIYSDGQIQTSIPECLERSVMPRKRTFPMVLTPQMPKTTHEFWRRT